MVPMHVAIVDSLGESTEGGEGGFGSTGVERKEKRAELSHLYIITIAICALLYIQKLMEKKY